MANSIRKQQKKQLYKELQKAEQDVRKSLAPKVQQLGPSKRAKLTLTKEVRRTNEQPSIRTIDKSSTKKLKKTVKRKKK